MMPKPFARPNTKEAVQAVAEVDRPHCLDMWKRVECLSRRDEPVAAFGLFVGGVVRKQR